MHIFKHSKNGKETDFAPEGIIVHSMADRITWDGYNHAAEDFLDEIGLSAHSLISVNGDNIRMRGDNELAYHAKQYNSQALGIEFRVPGVISYADFLEKIKTPYLSEAAYWAGLEQILTWFATIPSLKWIRPHEDLDSGKFDPGAGFPWEQMMDDLRMEAK
jgi:N-acetyl-anhydromuramyl-L-alanine amidase AmpD